MSVTKQFLEKNSMEVNTAYITIGFAIFFKIPSFVFSRRKKSCTIGTN